MDARTRPPNEVHIGKLETALSEGRKLQVQLVHVPNPQPWELNPSGTMEDYVILREDDKTPLVIRVSSRSPLTLEQIDPGNARGGAIWQWLFSALENKGNR